MATGYLKWIMDETPRRKEEVKEVEDEVDSGSGQGKGGVSGEEKKKRRKRPVVIPYVKGVSETIRRVFQKFDIPLYFKPTNTLRQHICCTNTARCLPKLYQLNVMLPHCAHPKHTKHVPSA